MRTRLLLIAFALFLAASPAQAQEITGLNDWSLFISPGHNYQENKGAFGYSEAEKNLHVGLNLRDLLRNRTDIDSVWIARKTDNVEVTLRQRVNFANRVGAAHFHAIHSNAGGSASTNFLAVLWPQYKNGEEAKPHGGKRMSDLMAPLLAKGMRIPLEDEDGSVGECDFYGVSHCRGRSLGTGKGGSRNFVQSFTDMPSELSEAGFHTNPRQNQLNMNADWKRLEARAMFWSMLDYNHVNRPDVSIVTGTVRDGEFDRPLNGATVTIADTSYTTDTYESLFHKYSNNPDKLRNGFYYLDDLPDGPMTLKVEKEGYPTYTKQVTTRDTFFTFQDVDLISNVPPRVVATTPADTVENFSTVDDIKIDFSRKMKHDSTEAAFSISPDVDGSFQWRKNSTRLVFDPDVALDTTTTYTVTIGEDTEGIYGDPFDGNGDGTGGGAFTLQFTTGRDVNPPTIVESYPTLETRGHDVALKPIITVDYNEELDTTSIRDELFTLETLPQNGEPVSGVLESYTVNQRSAISFFPSEKLDPETLYQFVISPGLRDRIGNETETKRTLVFTTSAKDLVVNSVDDFEDGANGWYSGPAQSGSTHDIVPDSTSATVSTGTANRLTGSTQSYRIDYGWDESADSWLIRQYLNGGAPSRVDIKPDDMLQAYVFGDGSGNQMRFVISEGGGYEASPWTAVDWIGWRLVSWDLSEEAVAWVNGDGAVEHDGSFDSIQLTHESGAATYGQIYFDDLRTAQQKTGTAATESPNTLPTRLALHTPYPNPMQSQATFRLDMPKPANVHLTIYNTLGRRVATLIAGRRYTAGTHKLTWQPEDLPAGVYFARLESGGSTRTTRFVVVR